MPGPLPARAATSPVRAERFRYAGIEVDERAGVVRGRYEVDDRSFTEVVTLGPGGTWSPAAHEAARLVVLLAGVSYFKTGAPPVLDLGDLPVRPAEVELLRSFVVHGLGEFAYRNDLDLTGVTIVGGVAAPAGPAAPALPATGAPVGLDPARPLVPFGGGLDSLVTVELVRAVHPDIELFVVNRAGDRFAAIEQAIEATGLPVARAERELDPQLLRPTDADRAAWFNGHVPVTGILSAIAVLRAVLDGRGAVVMSNEWSASSGNVLVGDRWVNHQWSKGEAFESAFRAVVHGAIGSLDYFSALRPFSELWIARRFAELGRYLHSFHSCNRAFALDPARRLDRWCGDCDKCAFIDLILSPFVDHEELRAVFGGREPLDEPAQAHRFRTLLATVEDPKPFECVGDVDECRTALVLAAERPDRQGGAVLATLLAELGPERAAVARAGAERLLAPLGAHHVPDALLAAAALG